MSIDLNIDNYDLDDILNLFKIPVDFNENELKQAKQIVLKTHPDKSGLSSEYFLFYSKAYKMLYSVWEFRKKGSVNKTSSNTDYSNVEDYSEKDKKKLLDNFFASNNGKLKNINEFNEWFNDQFEKNKTRTDDETGYGDWLRSDDDLHESSGENVSMATMKNEFDKKKNQVRALIVRQDVSEFNGSRTMFGTELMSEGPTEYSSGMFSNLAYEDLHKAHTETVIPVTDEDYESIPKFKSVNEYMNYRNAFDIKPLTEQKAQEVLNRQNDKESEKATRRAYELARQTEIAKQKNQGFWGNIQLLGNKAFGSK